MKGRVLSILLIMIISVLGLNACNVVKDKVYEATGAEYFEFTQREDGNYAVSAKEGATLPEKIKFPTEYEGKAVVEIKANGFKDNQTITEIIIPVGYEFIGVEAFSACEKLSSLNIGQHGGSSAVETEIGFGAFKGCNSLTSVTLGDCVKVIGGYAFYETLITSLSSCRGLTKIDGHAFGNCTALKDFYIPASLVDIHEDAFKGAKNVSFRVSDSNPKYTVKDGAIVSK